MTLAAHDPKRCLGRLEIITDLYDTIVEIVVTGDGKTTGFGGAQKKRRPKKQRRWHITDEA